MRSSDQQSSAIPPPQVCSCKEIRGRPGGIHRLLLFFNYCQHQVCLIYLLPLKARCHLVLQITNAKSWTKYPALLIDFLWESQNALRTTKTTATNHTSKAAPFTKLCWALLLLGILQKLWKSYSNFLKKYKIWNPNKLANSEKVLAI